MSATLRLGLAGVGPWGGNYLRTLARRHDAVVAAVAAAGPFRLPLDCVVEDFCAAIRAGRPDTRQLDLAIGVMRVLDQAGRAAT